METNPSLWVATTPGTDYPTLDHDIEADVIVVGSGITGLTTARLLAGRGLAVVVIEARKLCYGTTGFTTAKVTALHSTIYSELSEKWGDETAALYAAANQAAVAKVKELAAADGIECDLREASAYTYAEAGDHLARIEAEVEAARRAGLDVSFTTETELPYEVAGAVRLGGQAQFHPRRYCLGLAEALVKEGGLIFENSPARRSRYRCPHRHHRCRDGAGGSGGGGHPDPVRQPGRPFRPHDPLPVVCTRAPIEESPDGGHVHQRRPAHPFPPFHR